MGHNQDDTCHMSKELSPRCPQAYLPIMVEQSQGGEKKGYHQVEGKDVIISIITFGRRGKRKKEKLMSTSPAHHGPIFLSLSSVPSYTVHLSKVSRTQYPFYITQAISNTSSLSWTPPSYCLTFCSDHSHLGLNVSFTSWVTLIMTHLTYLSLSFLSVKKGW